MSEVYIDCSQNFIVITKKGFKKIDIYETHTNSLFKTILTKVPSTLVLICNKTNTLYVAKCWDDRTTIEKRNLTNLEKIDEICVDITVETWTLSQSGKYLAVVGEKDAAFLKLIDTSLKTITELNGIWLSIKNLIISNDDRLIAAKTHYNIVVWNADGSMLRKMTVGKDLCYSCLKIIFANDSKRLIYFDGNSLLFWNVVTDERQRYLQVFSELLDCSQNSLSISADDRYLLLSHGGTKQKHLLDLKRNQTIREIETENSDVKINICNDGSSYFSIVGKNISKKLFLDVKILAQTATVLLKKGVSVYLILDVLDFLYAFAERHHIERESSFQRFLKVALIETIKDLLR